MGRPQKSFNKKIEAEIEVALACGEFNGFCYCGCGQKTEIASTTKVDTKGNRASFAGLPKRYIIGHEPQYRQGSEHAQHLGRIRNGKGHWLIYVPDHPRANRDGYFYEHVVMMEKKLGRYLYKQGPGKMRANDEVVHHRDENKNNNKLSNLQLMTHAEHVSHHRKKDVKNGKTLFGK